MVEFFVKRILIEKFPDIFFKLDDPSLFNSVPLKSFKNTILFVFKSFFYVYKANSSEDLNQVCLSFSKVNDQRKKIALNSKQLMKIIIS